MSATPSVTVLMAVYNGLPYLREAVESVLNQTFADFEFLIIDDSSTDGSVEYILSCQDPRIRLVRNEHNLGTSRSITKGLQLARASYVMRIDQDDVCTPDRLKEQLAMMQQRPDLAVTCTWEYGIDSEGRKIRDWQCEVQNYGAFLGPVVLGICPIWHPSVMFRRDAALDVGGYLETCAPAEDFELTMRLALRRYNAAVVPKFLVMQRDHGNRQSVKKAAAQWKKTQQCHDEMIRTFCHTPEAGLVAKLLRLPAEAVTPAVPASDLFWVHCRSKQQLGRVLLALHETLSNMRTGLDLSAEEFVTLKRVVYGRLGPGARLGDKFLFLPGLLFYPLFFALSPLLMPRVRRVLASVYETFCGLRYPGRLIHAGLERWANGKRA